jgi:hypothetical protein
MPGAAHLIYQPAHVELDLSALPCVGALELAQAAFSDLSRRGFRVGWEGTGEAL